MSPSALTRLLKTRLRSDSSVAALIPPLAIRPVPLPLPVLIPEWVSA